MRTAAAPAIITCVQVDAVWLHPTARAGCVPCAEGRGCGADTMLGHGAQGPVRFDRHMVANAAVGDRVWISMPLRAIALAAACLFGVPLLGFFVGAVSASHALPDAASASAVEAAGAAVGILAGVLFARQLLLRTWVRQWLPPKVSYER